MKIRLARDPLAVFVAASRTSDVTPLLGGRRPVFLVSGPASVQHVLQLQSRLFVRRPIASIQALLGESIVLQDGDSWFTHRRLLQPAFHRPHLATLTQATEAHITTWLTPWVAQTGLKLADLGQAMRELTRRLLAAALFSISMSQQVSDQLGADVSICLDHTTAQIMRPYNLPAWIMTPARRRFVAARTRIENTLLACVQQRRADPNPPGDVLTMLAQAHTDTGEFMTDDELRSELMTIYLAGHDSTAQVLTYLWLQLAQHPDVLARVRTEIAMVRASGVPLHQALGHMTYMRQVLAETMRLFPPIYLTRRTATEDVVLGGVPIPAGTMLLISPYATHRIPALWPNPERFDPGRFADGLVSRTDGSYLPFLIGPKRCVGENLAMQTMLLVFALLAEQFTLTPQAATIQVRTGATLQLGRMPMTVCRRTRTSM